MAEDIKLEGNVFPVLRTGDEVETPEGPATVYEIAIHGGKYGDRFELEPPAIFVKMADDEAIRQVCMCVLKLSNTVHEKLLSKEFDRLWPPIDEDVPEDAHMLVDHDKEESTIMRSIRTRTAETGDFFNLSEGEDRIIITPADASALDDFEVELADLTLDENRVWMEIFKDVGMPHRWVRPADVGAPANAELIAEVDGPAFIYLGDEPMSDLLQSGEIVFERFRERKTAMIKTAGDLSPDQAELADEWGLSNDDTSVAVFEMLEKEDLSVEDVEVKEGIWGWKEAADMAWVEMGNQEYGVAPSYDDAEELAVAEFRDQVEDDPENYLSLPFFQDFIDEKKLREFLWSDEVSNNYDRLLEEDVEDAVEELERLGFDVESAYGEDDEFDEASAQDLVESLADDYAEKVTREQLSDPVGWLEDIYGKEELGAQLVKWGMIDIDAAVKEAINTDGPGHFLASYDGELHELTSGGVYWRHN